jgi:hypothetical protein
LKNLRLALNEMRRPWLEPADGAQSRAVGPLDACNTSVVSLPGESKGRGMASLSADKRVEIIAHLVECNSVLETWSPTR